MATTSGLQPMGLEAVLANIDKYLRDAQRMVAADKQIEVSLDRISTSSQKTQGFLKSAASTAVGFLASTVILGGAQKITAELGNIVNAASDLNESANKAQVIFGKSIDVVQEFTKTSAKAFGISKQQAFEYAGTLGNILKVSGLTTEASADYSVKLIKLAADMASFNNISIDEALEKIRSGLVGEAEPLRTVGVLLSETRVQQEAYRSGIAETGAVLTDQQKVQARYNLIMQDTAAQQGDFTRTSGGLANSQRILSATFKDLEAQLGAAFLPAVIAVVHGLNSLLTAAAPLGPGLTLAVNKIGAAFNGLLAVARPVFDFLKQNPEVIAGVAAAIVTLLLPAIIEWTTATVAQIATNVALLVSLIAANIEIIAVAAAVGLLVTGLILLIEHWDAVSQAVGEFADATMGAVGAITGGILGAITGLISKTARLGANIGAGIAQGLAASARVIFNVAGQIVAGLIQLLNPFNWVFGSDIVDVYSQAGKEAGEGLMKSLIARFDRDSGAVVDILRKPLGELRDIVADLEGELGRLAGLPTRESANEDLEKTKLKLRALDLEAKAQQEKAERDKKLADLQDALRDANDWNRQSIEDQIKALENQKGPAEEELERIDKQIEQLDRLGEKRQLERQALIDRGLLADQTLATDQQVLKSMQDMVGRIGTVTGAIHTQADTLQTDFIPSWMNLAEEADKAAKGVGKSTGDISASVDEMSQNISDDLDKINKEIQEKLEKSFDQAVDKLKNKVKQEIEQHLGEIVIAFGIAAVAIGLILGGPLVAAILGVGLVAGVLAAQIVEHWDDIERITGQVWGRIKDFLSQNWQEILSIALLFLTGPLGLVTMFATNAFGIRDTIVNAIGEIPRLLLGLAGEFAHAGDTLIHALIDGFKGTISFAGDIGSALQEAIGGVLHSGIKSFDDLIPDSIDLFPHLPGGNIDLPDNPFSDAWDAVTPFAAGGIVTSPTLGLLGEAGPEAVIPLPRGGGAAGVGRSDLPPAFSDFVDQALADLQQFLDDQLADIEHFTEVFVNNMQTMIRDALSAPTRESADAAVKLTELRLQQFDLEQAAAADQAKQDADIRDLEAKASATRETAARIVERLETQIAAIREASATKVEGLEARIETIRSQAAAIAEAGEAEIERIRTEAADKVKAAEQNLEAVRERNALRIEAIQNSIDAQRKAAQQQEKLTAEQLTLAKQRLSDVEKDLNDTQRAADQQAARVLPLTLAARLAALNAEHDQAKVAVDDLTAKQKAEKEANDAAAEALADQLDAARKAAKAEEERLQDAIDNIRDQAKEQEDAIQRYIDLTNKAAKQRENALQDEIDNTKKLEREQEKALQKQIDNTKAVAEAEEKRIQDLIDGINNFKSANEKALDEVNKHIDALDRENRRRQLQRDIIIAQSVAADQTLQKEDDVLAKARDWVGQVYDGTKALVAQQQSLMRNFDQIHNIIAQWQTGTGIAFIIQALNNAGFTQLAALLFNLLATWPVPLASGGVVTEPTLAMLAEGGHPEAVIPLGQLDSMARMMAGGVNGQSANGEFRNYGQQTFVFPGAATDPTVEQMRRALGA